MAPLHGGSSSWIPERTFEYLPSAACQAPARAQWLAADSRRLVSSLAPNQSKPLMTGRRTILAVGARDPYHPLTRTGQFSIACNGNLTPTDKPDSGQRHDRQW